ncbi:HSDL2 protein, partial [Polypterus senegalus]
MLDLEQHSVRVKAKEFHECMITVYGESAPSSNKVKVWSKQFKWGRESIEDDPHTERPVEATSTEMYKKSEDFILSDRRIKVSRTAEEMGILAGKVWKIINKKFGMSKHIKLELPFSDLKTIREEHSNTIIQIISKLAGCTLFITGASRGIGKAIALKAAKDGANIVIAAKTSQPHPKLPGTIYTAAEEIEAAGGKAFPCVVDVRDEQQVSNAVEEAVKKFGVFQVLDHLVPIALPGGAEELSSWAVEFIRHPLAATPAPSRAVEDSICHGVLREVEASPPAREAATKRPGGGIELPMVAPSEHMQQGCQGPGPPQRLRMCVCLSSPEEVQLGSKYCVPYLRKSKNPHILNLSPPLNLKPVWFKNHTAILTAAMEMLGGGGVAKQCRKPDIMADAAYSILSRPVTFTGNFVIDDDLLQKEGIKDFDVYAVAPGHPLLPDFFLDDEPEALAEKMEEYGASPAFKSGKAKTESSSPVTETFEIIKGILNPDVVKSTQGIYKFDLSGEHSGIWYIDLKNGSGSAGSGDPQDKPDVTMSMDSADFVKMFSGNLKPTMAFMSGKLKIKGDMGLAIKMEKMMGQLKPKL